MSQGYWCVVLAVAGAVISMGAFWQCVWTYANMFLLLEHLVLFVVSSIYLRRIWPWPRSQRRPQKLFLLFTALNGLQNFGFNVLWPWWGWSEDPDGCVPPILQRSRGSSLSLYFLSVVPFSCFLAAFTASVSALGRLFWIVLRKEGPKYSTFLTSLWVALGVTILITALEILGS